MIALAKLAQVPRWAWIALAFLVAAVLFGLWLADQKRDAVEADRARSSAEASGKARKADERAHVAREGKAEEVEDGNRKAREAAAGGDDPLGDGLRSLRP